IDSCSTPDLSANSSSDTPRRRLTALSRSPSVCSIRRFLPEEVYLHCAPIGLLSPMGRGKTHKRELTALSPCSTPSSCRLLLSVRACPGSMVQPGAHREFLMPPTP